MTLLGTEMWKIRPKNKTHLNLKRVDDALHGAERRARGRTQREQPEAVAPLSQLPCDARVGVVAVECRGVMRLVKLKKTRTR